MWWTSSNICRKWVVVCVLACGARTASAIDPMRTVSQYVREQWTAERGFPRGPVYSISQTPDGYLWIGTESGLIRFDGFNFRAAEAERARTHVLGLMADGEGNLWARLRRPTLLRYRDGQFLDAMASFGFGEATAAAIARSREGALLVWALKGEPHALALRKVRFEVIAEPREFSRSPVLAFAQTENGDLWVGTRDAGLYRITASGVEHVTRGLPDLKINALAPCGGGRLWIATDNGIAQWDGTKVATPMAAEFRGMQVLALLTDRDANLWVGTNSNGLARVTARGVAWVHEGGPAVTALFEDREGNLWVGRSSELERIRDSAFVTYSREEGLASDRNGAVFADGAGRLWFAPIHGGLVWMRDGVTHRVAIGEDAVYSIAGGRRGLWLGRKRGGLTLLEPEAGMRATTFTTADGLAQNSVYSVFESRDGAVWAGTLSGGVSRFLGGLFQTFTTRNGLASDTVTAMAETTDGAMWFGTPAGLSSFDGRRWKTLAVTNVNCLLADAAGGLWAGTASGLWSVKDGAAKPLRLPVALRGAVLGMAESGGALWVTTAEHVLRVNPADASEVQVFTQADGLRGTEGVKRSRTVVAGADGRIWLAMNRGIALVDAARIGKNAAPAFVDIQGVVADGSAMDPRGEIRIAGGNKRLTIQYAGLSLSIPERVRYRYLLSGFENAWSAPVAAREAVYTNLAPGAYRFRVVASNADGVWNAQERVLAFTVEPLVWQTWWFRMGVVLACAGAVLGLYRLRLRQMTERLNLRFEERLAERTRIAQELHDTLLQGFLSVSMQVHVAADGLASDSAAKPILGRALERMGQVIEEGRNAVRGLRSSRSASLDLENAFSKVREELGQAAGDEGKFRVIVEGEQRNLHPLLRDEVYKIGREALVNAFRHARASHVEIELRYTPNLFQVLVRDDGMGIDPKIVEKGRDGHWGLSGMQERADRIGARLHVYSRHEAGTEIELAVPGRLAYEQRTRRWKWGRTEMKG